MIKVATPAIPVSFTEGAIAEVRHLLLKEGHSSGKALRLGVKGGGCAGFTYILEFDTEQSGDNIYVVDGVKVLINKAQELYLYGTQLDFTPGLANRGFVFNNPNAEATCGCGTSFSA